MSGHEAPRSPSEIGEGLKERRRREREPLTGEDIQKQLSQLSPTKMTVGETVNKEMKRRGLLREQPAKVAKKRLGLSTAQREKAARDANRAEALASRGGARVLG